jgi:ribosomal protein S18 acetylase RimI-like enzyme
MHESARAAMPSDLTELVRLAELAATTVTPVRGGRMHLQLARRQPPLLTSFQADLEDPRAVVVVGAIDSVVVGYGAAVVVDLPDGSTVASVTDLFVEPAGRGVGIGELVMDALVAWAQDHGCEAIDAVALPGDRETKNFFERFGLTARAIVVHRRLDAAP